MNRWERLPDLPRPLHHTAVVVFEGRAWAIGGYTLFEGDAWEPGPAMQQAREHFALAVVGNDLYAVAGRVPDNLDSVEVLREGAERWEPGPKLHHSRSGIGAATVDGTACVAGGPPSSGEASLPGTSTSGGGSTSTSRPRPTSRDPQEGPHRMAAQAPVA